MPISPKEWFIPGFITPEQHSHLSDRIISYLWGFTGVWAQECRTFLTEKRRKEEKWTETSPFTLR